MDILTRQTVKDWEKEVNAVMRELIEAGVPPWDAIDKARDIVSRRRRASKNKRQML